jgi:hypothetical protein
MRQQLTRYHMLLFNCTLTQALAPAPQGRQAVQACSVG